MGKSFHPFGIARCRDEPSNDAHCMQNKVQDQEQNGNRQTMPKETKCKLDNANHDMKEKTYYYEHDYQADDNPNQGTERYI
jgi:hypothetical protein